MSSVCLFQKYSSKENVHSSNALLLLKRVYYYSPKIFYKVLATWIECEEDELLPTFIAQERGKDSVPDFCIRQNGFEVLVEAKEKNNPFSKSQIERHFNSFKGNGIKLFIALKPVFSVPDEKTLKAIDHSGITVIALTYIGLFESILTVCDENRDYDLIELLDEYRDYCNEENLIDDTNNTIMVRLAGKTMAFSVDPKNMIYYDKAAAKCDGFRYLALYNSKKIQYIGKITKIINGYKDSSGKPILTVAFPSTEPIYKGEEGRVLNAMKNQENMGDSTKIPHNYFLVEKFIQVDNFVKSSPRALYGKKKFYLDQFGLLPNCGAKAIADRMKDKTWEQIEAGYYKS